MIMTNLNSAMIASCKRAYLIGIGGVGMSALALVLKSRGYDVAGSDLKESESVHTLRLQGIDVYTGQTELHFDNSDLVIYSSAISEDHLELKAARRLGLHVFHRAQVLAFLFNQAETAVAVTGTHGKTTTSSMISFILSELNLNPTCLIGGKALNLKTNALLGRDTLWVSEVDESDKSHEFYAPHYAIITNLEQDHVDHYPQLHDLEQSFERFLDNLRNPGAVIYWLNDPVLKKVVEASGKPAISFGFSPDADFSADNIRTSPFGSKFDLLEAGFFTTEIELNVPGLHNIANALAAITLLIQLGLDMDEIKTALGRFHGAGRRLEVKLKTPELIVIDDYAHHPTEVLASIRALKAMGEHLTVVFQPHRISRMKHFLKEFSEAFNDVDEIILTEVYSAGESNPDQAGVKLIYERMSEAVRARVRVLMKHEVLSHLKCMPKQNPAVVAFLGAGDIGEIADEFAQQFKSCVKTAS